MRTAMMITPTLEEVRLAGAKIGLPDIQCQKFFYYYDAKGWFVGKHKMVSLSSALSHWKIVWMEDQASGRCRGNGHNGSGQSTTWAQREIDRICKPYGL